MSYKGEIRPFGTFGTFSPLLEQTPFRLTVS